MKTPVVDGPRAGENVRCGCTNFCRCEYVVFFEDYKGTRYNYCYRQVRHKFRFSHEWRERLKQ